MATSIKSGRSGNVANVDSDERLWTNAKSFAAESERADKGYAFIVHGVCHTALAASGGLIYIQNDATDEHFTMTRIFIDAQTLTKDIIVYFVKNPTPTGGTAVTPMNKSYLSGNTFTSTCKMSDAASDVTYTGGTIYHAFVVQSKGSVMRDVNGTNILYNGNKFLIGWATLDGTNAVDGEKIGISINGYTEKEKIN